MKTEEELRNDGYSYDYIDGYMDGKDSNIPEKDLSDFLTDLRNDGANYDYITGYEDGYYE